jgi:hypothetical protein
MTGHDVVHAAKPRFRKSAIAAKFSFHGRYPAAVALTPSVVDERGRAKTTRQPKILSAHLGTMLK